MEMQRIINFETTSDFVGGFVVPASKQASKQAFIFNKGLLLSAQIFFPVLNFQRGLLSLHGGFMH